jgi:hypothetical protein
MQNRAFFIREDTRRLEPPDQRVDAERQLPDELRDGHEALARVVQLEDAEQREGARDDDQRATTKPGPRMNVQSLSAARV